MAAVARGAARGIVSLSPGAGLRPEPAARSTDPGEPRLPLGRYRGGDARRAERARDRHRHPLPRPHALLRRAAEHRVRHGAGPGLQPLADGGMAAQGAGALRRDAGQPAESGGGGAGDRALRQRGAHRRHLPADRRGQPPLGAPQVRPDHGCRGRDRAAGLPAQRDAGDRRPFPASSTSSRTTSAGRSSPTPSR